MTIEPSGVLVNGIDEGVDAFRCHVRVDAMTEVGDEAMGAKLGDHLLDQVVEVILVRVQRAGVQVALQSHTTGGLGSGHLRFDGPVEADDVVAGVLAVGQLLQSVVGVLGENGHWHFGQALLAQILPHSIADLDQVRQRELIKLGWSEEAGVRIEDLQHLGTGTHLRGEEGDHGTGENVQQLVAFDGVLSVFEPCPSTMYAMRVNGAPAKPISGTLPCSECRVRVMAL
ncbi:hypothetical protein TYRP_016472 [Tyrophagus putrescentiae]|nr:hypothetical protein TYRP_016472 [Tyrophagus putrescentiae]